MTETKIPSPFSPDYTSQITPFKERVLKRPDLTTIPNRSINCELPEVSKAKQWKLRRASI